MALMRPCFVSYEQYDRSKMVITLFIISTNIHENKEFRCEKGSNERLDFNQIENVLTNKAGFDWSSVNDNFMDASSQ